MFDLLVALGYKEIEVGFPAASQTDFDFVRSLIEEDLIPDDVTIQVLTQAREELIERTYESMRGARQAIVHLYNSTSILQRRVVFGWTEDGIMDIAVQRRRSWCKKLAESLRPGTDIRFEYSPGVYTGTELDFAVEICEAVIEVWQPTPSARSIINLPATVEMATPNVYADSDRVDASPHRQPRNVISQPAPPQRPRHRASPPPNSATWPAPIGSRACLFGNGERTGNVCLVDARAEPVHPGHRSAASTSPTSTRSAVTVEYCNQLPVHPRHPYGGELVYTAFSGSHQDAIKKGFEALERDAAAGVEVSELWAVPVPADRPEGSRPQLRGGHPGQLRSRARAASPICSRPTTAGPAAPAADRVQPGRAGEDRRRRRRGAAPSEIWNIFHDEYLPAENGGGNARLRLRSYDLAASTFVVELDGTEQVIQGRRKRPDRDLRYTPSAPSVSTSRVLDYAEHAIGAGEDARAAAYVEAARDGRVLWACGIDSNILTSSLYAVVSAVNRA